MNLLKNSSYFAAFWLGGILSIYTNLFEWQWWLIVVPTIVLYNIEIGYWKGQSKK